MPKLTDKQHEAKLETARRVVKLIRQGKKSVAPSMLAKTVVDWETGQTVDMGVTKNSVVIEHFNTANVEKAVDDIVISWRKTAESFIDTATVLKRYRGYDNWEDIKIQLIKTIPPSSVNYLLAIGQNSVLTTKKYTQQLPNELLKIYRLSMIEESVLETKIKRGEIKPELKASQIKEWVKTEPRRKPHLKRPEKIALSMTITLKITIPTENHKSNAKKIKNDIKTMYEGEDYDVVLDEKIKSNY